MIIIITLYRLPVIISKGTNTVKVQLDRISKIKIANTHWNKILIELTEYIKSKNTITDMILVGNINKSIILRAIERFFIDNGLFDIHS